MLGYLPGTLIETDITRKDAADYILTPLFMGGGLVMSQVVELTGLKPHMVQNWVKRGFVSAPKGKKYTRRQFCRIVIINLLKDTMHLDRIAAMLSYINGRLNDESDDIIDDSDLYGYFTGVVGGLPPLADDNSVREAVARATAAFESPRPGAAAQLNTVLEIMVVAYMSAQLRRSAEAAMAKLDI